MCLDFAARVVSVTDQTAVIEADGRQWPVSTLLAPETHAGDWVRVLAGTVVERLPPDTAKAINRDLAAARLSSRR